MLKVNRKSFAKERGLKRLVLIKRLDQKYVSKNTHDLYREQKEDGPILA